MIVPIEEIDIYYKEDFEIRVQDKEDVERIICIVNSLDALSQQIFRLKLFADYTFLEISNVLNIPESTAKTRYYSIIRKIRKTFKEG